MRTLAVPRLIVLFRASFDRQAPHWPPLLLPLSIIAIAVTGVLGTRAQ